ncbi:helix-turn-helix domain-containing protein [Rhodococcus sp. BH5]|uniref:helix-turn-helix domain-containing protein n=1 Tax=Rhodococcus sp. BH5 TaxID=2871702 RepID=UPI0022CD6881|nr:helix-turn-helix domain-containing protein [Rhodococcus sp. BH5]MCZ9635032.1 helix-turn-helix domain-containing protein [Rhodococcus sp. BH5]
MRVSAPLTLRDGDHDRLQAEADCVGTSHDSVARAQIVLLAAAGHSNTMIAKGLGTSRPTVISWRSRYAEHGIDGLTDSPKPGRPRVVEPHTIIAALLTTPPARYEIPHWNSRLLAQHLQIGKTTVQAAWKEYGVKPCGPDRFTFATVPPLAAKITAVIGLHIGVEANAIALTVTRTSGRPDQARSSHSVLPLDQFHRYLARRALLLDADTPIATRTTVEQPSRPDADLAEFCNRTAAMHPNEQVHLIFDTFTEHLEHLPTTPAAYPNVRTHHTLTAIAWLHLVDVWLAITAPHAT